MPLTITATINRWTSDRRLYLNAAGQVVEATDPTRQTLLVAAGGVIPLEQAQALGLAPLPETDPDAIPDPNTEKGRAKPPLNKAKTAPENKST